MSRIQNVLCIRPKIHEFIGSGGLLRIPDDVMRTVVEFTTRSLRAVLSLQLISHHFHVVMRQPKMLWHVHARFNDFYNGQHLGLGLRHLSIPNAQTTLAPLALLHGLRTLHMPSWRTKADVTQYLGHMSHLTELDLSNTWWLTKLDGVPPSLKRLNVKNTRIRSLPSMPNLEELDVSSCAELCMFSTCPKVRSLKMAGSSSSILDFRHLTELQDLDISGGDLIRFHVGEQLCVLKAECCENLHEIPDLPNLLELNVKFCHRLAGFPQLPSLLKLNNYGSPTCPNRFMVQLRELDASELTFDNFECLDMLPRLEKLSLRGCAFVEQDFSKLPNLTCLNLELDASASLDCLPTILTHLQLDSEVSDLDMMPLMALTNLKTLRVYSENITDAGMACISRIRGLENLFIDNERHWSVSSLGVSYLVASTNLRHLELLDCALEDLTVMATIPNLGTLDIRGNLPHLPPLILEPLADAKRLTTLKLNDCVLASLRGLNQIQSLDVLSVVNCRLVCEDMVDLIPTQLTCLTLSPIPSIGRQWADFIKQLKASHPWMEIRP